MLSIQSAFGFSCNSPSGEQEKLICNNPNLSSLHAQNTNLDSRVSNVKPDVSRDIGQLLYFDLKKCESDSECIVNSYNTSILSLNKVIQDSPKEFVLNNNISVENKTQSSPSNKTSEGQKTSSGLNLTLPKKLFFFLGILGVFILTPLIFYTKKFSQTEKKNFIKIQQSFLWIFYIPLSIIILGVSLFLNFLFSETECYANCTYLTESSNIFYITTLAVFSVFNFIWYQYRLGYVIDKNNMTLTFHSGLFTRKKIKINEIQSANQKEEFYQRTSKDGSVDSGYRYYINLVMNNGKPYRLSFDTDLESDQFYHVLTSLS